MKKIFFFIIYACSDKEKYDLMYSNDSSLDFSRYDYYQNYYNKKFTESDKIETEKLNFSNYSETSEFPAKYYDNPENEKSFNIDSELHFLSISNPKHNNGNDDFYKKLLQNAKENEKIIKDSEFLIIFFDEKILYENYYEGNFICFILKKYEYFILFLETIIKSENLSEDFKKKIKFDFFTKKFFEYIEDFMVQKLDELEKNEIITELEIIEYFNNFFNKIKNELYGKNNEEIILILENSLEELKNDIEKFYKNDDEKNNKNKYLNLNILKLENKNENDKIKKEIETQTTYRIKNISPENSDSQKSNIKKSDLKSKTETFVTKTSKSFSNCYKNIKYNSDSNNNLSKKDSISFIVYEKTEKKTRDNSKNVNSKNTKNKFKRSLNSNSNSKKSLKDSSKNHNTNCNKSFLYKCGSNDEPIYNYSFLLKKKQK